MKVSKRTNKLIALLLLFSMIVTCFQGVIAEDGSDGDPADNPSSIVTEEGEGETGQGEEEITVPGEPTDQGGGAEGEAGNNADDDDPADVPGETDPEVGDPDEEQKENAPGADDPEDDKEGENGEDPADDGKVAEDPDKKEPEEKADDSEPDADDGKKVKEPEDTAKAKDPESEDDKEPDQNLMRAGSPAKAAGMNWTLENYPDPASAQNWMWIRGENVTYEVNNDVVTGVVVITVTPTRSDYYAFYGTDIRPMSQTNPNTSGSYRFAHDMDVTLTDSSGTVIASGSKLIFYSPNPTTNYARLNKGETYTLTLRFNSIHTYYQQINDSLTLVKINARTRHNYVNGKCDCCYDEYPEDIYSHVGYRLATGQYWRRDHVYVYAADHPETRIDVYASEKVYIDGQLVSSFTTTSDHLRNDNSGYQEYLNSPNTYLPNSNSGTYVEITMWSGNKSLSPIRFKLYSDTATGELKTEVLAGKGSVQTLVLPTNAVIQYSNDPPMNWNGSEVAVSTSYYSFFDYGPYQWFNYQYWSEQPIPFSASVVRRNTDGLFEIFQKNDQGEEFYVPMGLGSNHYTYYGYPILYYALAVSLEKSDFAVDPLKIETFDVSLSDYTEDTATVTVTGKLSRDLINRQADEDQFIYAYTESLSLSVADKITKIYESDVGSDGSFTITLEGASLDANIVLRTQEDSAPSDSQSNGGTAPAGGGSGNQSPLRRSITAVFENGSALTGYRRPSILRVDGDAEEEADYTYGYADGMYETLYVPLLQMPLAKVWTDSEGNTSDEITARHKDDVVVVDILADGEVIRTVELTSTTDPAWETVVKGLPEYTHYERGSDPETITYTAKEKEIKGYSTVYGEEESSKYLILGEKITDRIFSGKHILLSESAKMALSIQDGNVVVVPFDPDDEYQKWSTEEKTFDYAFIWRGPGNPLGQYSTVVIKNDKTGQYLGITTAGPVLYDSTDPSESPGIAMYMRSSQSGFGVIRTATLYNSAANRFTSYRDFPDLTGYLPQEMMDSAIVVDPGAVYPGSGGNFMNFTIPPWPFLALKWYDAKMSSSFVTSLGSSILSDVNVYDESDGILYKVTNTPNSLVIEKSLEFETSGQEKTVKDETFYVALFTDPDRTERAEGFDVQKISVVNGSSGKVIIEGIPSGTYYIGETDANGTLITEGELSDGTAFRPEFDSYEVEIPENGTEGVSLSFKNVITDPPKTEDIIVTKKLIDEETGKDVLLTGKYTVFVALFSDEDHTVRVSEIKEIVIDGTPSGTATFEDIEEGTYYVSETNENGTAIDAGMIGEAVGYKASYAEGDKVTVTGENESEEVVFENVFVKETVDIIGTKTWVDDGKAHDNATEVKLTLTRKSAKKGSVAETLNIVPAWTGNTYKYLGLDKYDEEGYEYTYSVSEAEVAGYTTTQSGYNFTNTSKTEPPTSPSTGDPSVNYFNTYVVLMLISIGVVINVIIRLKKKS